MMSRGFLSVALTCLCRLLLVFSVCQQLALGWLPYHPFQLKNKIQFNLSTTSGGAPTSTVLSATSIESDMPTCSDETMARFEGKNILLTGM